MPKKKENILSVRQYAIEAGVGVHAIYVRRDRGQIELIVRKYRKRDHYFIDLDKFPIVKRQKSGPKVYPA